MAQHSYYVTLKVVAFLDITDAVAKEVVSLSREGYYEEAQRTMETVVEAQLGKVGNAIATYGLEGGEEATLHHADRAGSVVHDGHDPVVFEL